MLAVPLLLPLLGAPLGPQEPAPRYAALPLRSLVADPAAPQRILRGLRAGLEARGAWFVPAGDLEEALRERRIRYTESLSVEDARAIAEETGARWLLAGVLFDYDPSPAIALSLRVLDAATGERVRSTIVALEGDDFTGLLGLGTITDVDELAREVVARVLDEFTAGGAPRRPPERGHGGRGRPSDAVQRFVDEDFRAGALERLAILPLANRTGRPEAGLLFSDILAHQWFAHAGVQVVEASELRAALVRERLRSIDDVDPALLARIGSQLGTHYFLLGSIDRFAEDVYVDGRTFPEVVASVRILDAADERIVAASSLQRLGSDYHVVLGLGNVDDLVNLSSRAAAELVALLHR